MATSPNADSNVIEIQDDNATSDIETVSALTHENAKDPGPDTDGEEVTRNAEEEDEEDDSSISHDESDGHEADGANTGDGNVKDSEGVQLDEEILPITINLRNGEWHFRDQFTWSVKLPRDILGQEVQEYIEYNLNDPTIDVFSLRTAEDMDFPVGFDSSIARSIRAQLMTLIPIIWKEKQSQAIQARRNISAKRRTSSVGGISDSETLLNRLAQGGTATSEEWTKAISTAPEYPLNAVRKLFAGIGGDTAQETEKAAMEADDVENDLDEDEAANMKKRKRLQEEEATGRRKRKRGTAFEAHVLFDERISIKLNIAISGVQLQDQFDWDPSAPMYWAEIFARRLATELGLPREFELAIASEIRRQVLGYLAATSHQMPPDWHQQTGSSLQASTGILGLTASTGIPSAASSSANLDPELLTSSSNGISLQSSNGLNASSGAAGSFTRRGGARTADPVGFIPTRSLPILSLHNVIRAPYACAPFSPQLSAHEESKIGWEKALQRQASRSQRPTPSASSTTSNAHSSSQHASSSSAQASNTSNGPSMPSGVSTARPIAR